jgi:hypothetical protein
MWQNWWWYFLHLFKMCYVQFSNHLLFIIILLHIVLYVNKMYQLTFQVEMLLISKISSNDTFRFNEKKWNAFLHILGLQISATRHFTTMSAGYLTSLLKTMCWALVAMPVILPIQETDQEDYGSKPALTNSSWAPILKKPITKKVWMEWLKL